MLAVIVQLERVGDGMLHVHYCYIGIFSSVGLRDVVLTRPEVQVLDLPPEDWCKERRDKGNLFMLPS